MTREEAIEELKALHAKAVLNQLEKENPCIGCVLAGGLSKPEIDTSVRLSTDYGIFRCKICAEFSEIPASRACPCIEYRKRGLSRALQFKRAWLRLEELGLLDEEEAES